MNTKTRFLFALVIATILPASGALAGGQRGSVSRSSGSRPAMGSRPAFARPTATFQRSNYNWAGGNRWQSFSRANGGTFTASRASFSNRATFNRGNTNWNRLNNTSNRFATGWNGSNRVGATGFNHGGNSWHHHHGHHDSDNFFFFGGFGYPFYYSAWDYGYYPYAYAPYYPYGSYYYDPYGYSYGGGGGGGYSDGSGYYDPGSNSGNGHDQTNSDSVVARVQERLAHDGYYKGAIDGVIGSRTYYAIRSYQRDHNLSATGEITDDLLEQMGLR